MNKVTHAIQINFNTTELVQPHNLSMIRDVKKTILFCNTPHKGQHDDPERDDIP